MRIQFTVEIDRQAFKSPEDAQSEIDRINDILSDECYVAGVQILA